jgi:hypothetical protein
MEHTGGKSPGIATAVGAEELHRRLPELLREAESKALSVAIRPVAVREQGGLVLLRLDDLYAAALEQAQLSAFLILQTQPETYQCWCAVDKKQLVSSSLAVQGLSSDFMGVSTDGFAPLAGIKRTAVDGLPRVRILRGESGLLVAANRLAEGSMQPLLGKCLLQ